MTQGRTESPPNGKGLDKSEADQLPLVYLGHDLRAALAEMQAGIRLVQQLDLPESAQQLLKRCGATGDILDRIIDQSVLVCLGQGRPDLTTPETIRVEDFLANLSNRWTGLGAESGHTFQLRPSLGLPRELYVDATALDRILTAGRYVVPMWYSDISRLAHRAELKFPDRLPLYGDWLGFQPDVWWYEQ